MSAVVRRSAAFLPALLATACGSVSVHGIVRDDQGRAIRGASVAARDSASGSLLARTTSDANGCFHLFPGVPRSQVTFLLEVGGPGEKTLTRPVDRRGRDPYLVRLVGLSSPEESSLRAPTPDERDSLYDSICSPPVLPESSGLVPR